MTTRRDDDEARRLDALSRYSILDTSPEASFDEITRLASTLLGAPYAAISLVDDRRQWFKSKVGIDFPQTLREDALCPHVVTSGAFIESSDASFDPRFRDSSLVRPAGGIRFYAGAPLIVSSGHCLGTLCVFDTTPRAALTAAKKEALRDLAHLTVLRIEARQARLQSEIAASVVAATSDAVLAVGRDGLITFWNSAATRMFGHAVEDAIGSTLDLILPARLAAAHCHGFAKAAAGGQTSLVGTSVELEARRASGEEFPIELSLARWGGENTDGGGFAAIIRDISLRRSLESDRASARLFLDSIVMHLPAMLFVKDSESRKYLLFNKAGEDIVGISAAKVIGHTDEELFPDIGASYHERDTSALLSSGIETHESQFNRVGVKPVTLRTKRIVIKAPGTDKRYILGLSEDVTDLRQSEQHVLYLAHHDSLTGLLNRASLVERLETLIANEAPFAILSIDLDRFKAVNDQFGHLTGDRLLIEAGNRLRRVIATDDIVARIGGDEFVVVAVGCDVRGRVGALADAVLSALGSPYAVERFVAHTGASVGVVLSPDDGDNLDILRQAADLALYRAKASGRGTVCFFSGALDDEARARRMMENDLRMAINRDEIEVAYQPVVSCATGQVTSFEALARWNREDGTSVSPSTFIGIAEESGLIGQLGTSVLRQACRAAASWPDALKVAVNLSPLQFQSNDLIDIVTQALTSSGLPSERLQLEVTESVLVRNVDHTFGVLTALRSIGVQILLDDFGVGFSSLSYFERFPFDKVKIDQSFVRKMATTPAARAIIHAVVGLGRTLNMGIVAEGVETAEQAQALTEIGCTHLQGYYFSEPKPQEAFPHILKTIWVAVDVGAA